MVAIMAVVAALLYVVTAAPPLVSCALAVAMAGAWCAWLEQHPEAPLDADRSRDGLRAGTAGALAVHVLATSHDGTRSALAIAKRLTSGHDMRVVLVVPRLTSFAPQFDPTGPERTALIDEHRALAADVGLHVTALFCICARLDDVAHQLLGKSGLVIVGGRRRVWWPSREQRLVDRLIREGYPVVFADIGARPAGASMPRGRS